MECLRDCTITIHMDTNKRTERRVFKFEEHADMDELLDNVKAFLARIQKEGILDVM